MLLLTGPAGSGKTTHVLDRLRDALLRRDPSVRLLVPTATMARHLRNRVAREGHALRPRLIQALSRFVEPWVADLPQVSEPRLYLIVERAVGRANRGEFARVAQFAGFCAALARTIEEFSAAGCDARRLARHLPATPLAQAFLAVYEEVDRELTRCHLAMRATRLERAAALIAAEGMDGIHTVWLDGFHALPEPELAVIGAIARHASITVTLPTGAATAATRERLLALGFGEQLCEPRRAQPAIEMVEAPRIEREADEIARRILEQNAAGRPFRDIGVIVRNPDLYAPVLRTTFDRFGIPARFYLDESLAGHAVTRYLTGAVDAMLGGWDWRAVLAVLRLDPAIGASDAMDRFDFAVRNRLPGRGLDALIKLAGPGPIADRLARLAKLADWREQDLPSLFESPRTREPFQRDMVEAWRGQAAAIAGFTEALEEAAASFTGNEAIPAAEFWRTVKAVLRLLPLRPKDERRNVVHVLTAQEARQWELPVIFVCGLVEKQFPKHKAQDVFFPDAARRELKSAGINLRTSADADVEEQALFDSAITRATTLLVLSYPKYDDRGDQNLPSWGGLQATAGLQPSLLAQPQTRQARNTSPIRGITHEDLHQILVTRHATMKVTALESFVQCPFQFFSRHTLKLEPPPPRPADRLDFRVQGAIVHQVIAQFLRTREPIDRLFAAAFDEACREHNLVRGYRTESLRAQMREDLRRFAADGKWPITAGTSAEESFEFQLAPDITLRGRIDRMERTAAGDASVFDYKYSKKARDYARDEGDLQGPLYLIAVEKAFGLRPTAMHYCGLRGEVRYIQQDTPPGRIAAALETAIQAAARIRAGDVTVDPADADKCRYCESRDICRYAAGARVSLTAPTGA